MENTALQDLRHGEPAIEEVDQLARQTGHAIPLARKIFESECSKLRADATVTSYLTVLALRHTGDILRARQTNRRLSDEEQACDLFAA